MMFLGLTFTVALIFGLGDLPRPLPAALPGVTLSITPPRHFYQTLKKTSFPPDTVGIIKTFR